MNSSKEIRSAIEQLIAADANVRLLSYHLKIWPLVVLLTSLVATGIFWWNTKLNADAEQRLAFERRVDDIQSSLEQQLAEHQALVMGFAGIFFASERVTQKEFHNYFDAMPFGDNDSPFAKLAYHELVPATNIDRYVTLQRKNGLPEFRITPEGKRDLYAPLTYIEPFTALNRKLLGHDPYSVAEERRVIAHARDTDSVAISTKVEVEQNTGPNSPGFKMYLPIYRYGSAHRTTMERRTNFVGWIETSFRMQALIAHTFPKGFKNIDFEMYDGETISADNLLYDSNGIMHEVNPSSGELQSRQQISFGGRTWTVEYYADPDFEVLQYRKSQQLVLYTGLLFSTLLSMMVAVLISARRRRVIADLRTTVEAEEDAVEAKRLQAEQTQRESEWALNEAERIAQVGSYFTDINTGLWKGSATLDGIFGIDHSFEKTIPNWNMLVHPEDRKELLDYYIKVIRGDGKFNKEYRVIRPVDGEIRWVSALGEFAYDNNGNPITLKGTIQDITARKLAEIDLKQRIGYQRALLDNFPFIVWLKDEQGRLKAVNETFADEWGWPSSDSLIGMTEFDYAPVELAEQFRADDQAVMESGSSKHFEELVSIKGQQRWLETYKSAVKVGERIVGTVGFARDITDRKSIELELQSYRDHLEELVKEQTGHLQEALKSQRDSQRKLESMTNSVPGVVYQFLQNSQGEWRFTYVSKGVEELYEVSADEVMFDHNALTSRILSVDRNAHRTSIERAFTNATEWDHEFRIKTASGKEKWIRGRATAQFRSDGSALWSGILVDITEHKRIEEAAHEANRAKSSFLANMSHEIRTPMNGVIGMVDVLLNTRLDERQKKMAQVIRDSASTQLNILNEILDFSKIEAGKMELAPEPFSPEDLIKDTCANMVSHAAQKQGRLSWTIDRRIPKVLEGDVLRLRQVLGNIISNAIKFSSGQERKGKVAVHARLSEQEANLVWIEISVQDNGIGIDEATRARLFQSFHQADATTTRNYGGTGLGLVISQQLIELMGGEIKVESSLGLGSIFTLHIPFAHMDSMEAATTRNEREEPPVTRHQTSPSREEALQQDRLILIAEDNDTNQEVIRMQIDLLGFAADIAHDGRDALERWRTGDYALVLTDIHMPVMDGYQLTLAIRAEESESGTGHTPIVALTANALKGEADRCKESGMDDYLSKPVKLTELHKMLNKWLSGNDVLAADAVQNRERVSEANQPPLWDSNALNRMVGNNPDMHRRLLEKFLINAQQQIKKILSAVAEGNAEVAGQVAHALKSAARTVGAMRMGELCQQIEQVGSARNLQECNLLTGHLSQAFDDAEMIIRESLNQGNKNEQEIIDR